MDTATPRSFDELLEAYWACAYQEGLEKREHDNETGDAQRTLADLLDAWQQKERETIAQAERIVVLEAALNKIVWIKECGTDVLVDGRLVNATKTERDAMYEVARQALGGAK